MRRARSPCRLWARQSVRTSLPSLRRSCHGVGSAAARSRQSWSRISGVSWSVRSLRITSKNARFCKPIPSLGLRPRGHTTLAMQRRCPSRRECSTSRCLDRSRWRGWALNAQGSLNAIVGDEGAKRQRDKWPPRGNRDLPRPEDKVPTLGAAEPWATVGAASGPRSGLRWTTDWLWASRSLIGTTSYGGRQCPKQSRSGRRPLYAPTAFKRAWGYHVRAMRDRVCAEASRPGREVLLLPLPGALAPGPAVGGVRRAGAGPRPSG